ncbi:hypothetical protein ACHAPT_013281 [Fusarium lateritium]
MPTRISNQASSSAATPVEVDVPNAIVTYTDDDDMIQMLSANPSRQVTFHMSFDLGLGVAFFKIRVPLEAKAFPGGKIPVFLHICPTRISSLEYENPDEPPDIVNEQLGAEIACLKFRMKKPADLIVPRASLVLKRKDDWKKLEALKALARHTSFDVFFEKDVLQDSLARELCALVASPTVGSICQMAEMTTLYGGRGARVFSQVSTQSSRELSPPPYDQTKSPPPPTLPDEKEVEPSSDTTLGKRSIGTAFGRDELESILEVRDKRQAEHNERVLEVLNAIRKGQQELREHIDKRFNELDFSDFYSRDKVDKLMSDNEDWTETKIENEVLGAKGDMQEDTKGELDNTEERLLRRFHSAKWVLDLSSV